ncbi:AcpP Acyl carrier protein [Rhabdaerophilaceae bacterium]
MLAAPQIETLAGLAQPNDSDRELINGFLRQVSPTARSLELHDDTQLLTSGLLDSLGVLQMMAFLSDELGIEIGDDDFTLDNFETVGALLAFVNRRKS